MKTKKTVLFDNENNVLGFSDAQIEPVETMKKVKTELKKTQEFKDIDKKRKSIPVIMQARAKAAHDSFAIFYQCAKRLDISYFDMQGLIQFEFEEAKKKLNDSELAIYDAAIAQIKAKESEVTAVMNEVKGMIGGLQEKEKELIESQAVYFEPRNGEKIIEDVEYDAMVEQIGKLKKGERLKIS
jgi:hypothetical protein